MKKERIIYIISDIDKALAFEWIAVSINKEKFDLQFILVGSPGTQLSIFLAKQSIKYFEVGYEKKKHFIKAWWKVLTILWKQRPTVVHTHLWVANLLGLSTAWVLNVKKRIFTRHHAIVHHKDEPSGLKWDKLNNRLATHIIAISNNVAEILVELDKADPKKVTLINHGFDFNYFQQIHQLRIEKLRQKYKIDDNSTPIIGVISRYLELKGIQYIIPSFSEILKVYPKAHLILANARGNYAPQIKSLLSTLPNGSYTEISFESDLAALYQLFDVFVHVPIDKFSEAFGQIYIEALASGIPSVFTLSGIACDFIEHEKNALVVGYKNPDAITQSICRLIGDKGLNESLRREGRLSLSNKFTLENMIAQLEKIYNK